MSLNNKSLFGSDEDLEQVISLRVLHSYVHLSIISLWHNSLNLTRYFVSKSLSFYSFRDTCRCTLENSLNIIREYSGKKHVFVTVDEFTRVIPEDAAPKSARALQTLLVPVFSLIDEFEGNRTNFVFSSLASSPLRDIKQGSGRESQASHCPCMIDRQYFKCSKGT